jgi:hypothetical protein
MFLEISYGNAPNVQQLSHTLLLLLLLLHMQSCWWQL